MESVDARRFAQQLTQLNQRSNGISQTYVILAVLFCLYLVSKYLLRIDSEIIVPSVCIAYGLYNYFLQEWLNMRFRCPQCKHRFFAAWRPIFPVHRAEKCQHCGTTIGELEDIADVRLDIRR